MTSETATTIYRRADIEGSTLGDEIVFFDDRAGKYFATGPVGADIWKMLESPMSLNAIITRLIDLYEVDEATCRQETRSFIDQMVELGLIRNA